LLYRETVVEISITDYIMSWDTTVNPLILLNGPN